MSQDLGRAVGKADARDMEEVAPLTCEVSLTREVRNSLELGTAGVSEDPALREKEAESEDATEERVIDEFRDQLITRKRWASRAVLSRPYNKGAKSEATRSISRTY
jgi:hypothetical protein